MTHDIDTASIPRVGMFATVRNRRGVVSSVTPADGDSGRLHLVHLEYKDDQYPPDEQLLWELEPQGTLLEPTALPVAEGTDPMPPEDFDALLRASRWSSATPYLDPDGRGPLQRLPVSSPFHGAVQVEDFQLVPLLKAMRMPRVNLLIADDVGLGKTIEAGLILRELLLRRRIRRVLILTPASLRMQWRDEMWEKFSLTFNLIDRAETHLLRKRLGMDANPWRSFSRMIASYHYLRQDDVLDQFMSACRTPEGSAHLPWDLLIVDECHNLMPSPFGDDSDLCRMLRLLAPQFEHRIFLSATPHNGHTRCFTGLLEILDPVRFSRTDELKPAERRRIQQVVLRRLKREVNARTSPPRFCNRLSPIGLTLSMSTPETDLSNAFDAFRTDIRQLMGSGSRGRRRAGSFAVEILGKRLLSCPIAFAESWHRCREGLLEENPAVETDVDAARRILSRDTGDDRETQSRESTASNVVGAWLKTFAHELKPQIEALDDTVAALGIRLENEDIISQTPVADARFSSLLSLVDSVLRPEGDFTDEERLVVFTEYKTTLDYLTRRLREIYEPERILTLFGGMNEVERDQVKLAFNDPSHPVRILLATDAAAEGLNLQRTARHLLHYDCPWNPSRLEQRNGRLDRHGQARDVYVYHFVSDQDHDLRFLSYVIEKAHDIREDLGSANEIFDEATHRRLVEGEDLESVRNDLEKRVEKAQGRAALDADDTADTGAAGTAAADQLQALAEEMDLDPASLRDTLEAAMAVHAGRPQLDCTASLFDCKVLHPSLPGWSEVIDTSLRIRTGQHTQGPVPRLAFTPDPFLRQVGERMVFSPRPDVVLMHLSHPMLQQAISALTRRRFPGAGESVSRWTVRLGQVPEGVEALVLLSIEELAVNALRETFHHWVRTLIFPIKGGRLGSPLNHRPAFELRPATPAHEPRHQNRARDVIEDTVPDLKAHLIDYARRLTEDLRHQLEEAGREARVREEDRYRSRQGEISSLIRENTLIKLENEIAQLKLQRQQGLLFDEEQRLEAIDRSIQEKEEEIARRTRHYEEVKIQLDRERDRILKRLLPRRHTMAGSAQVFPVCIEVRLPGGPS